MKKPIKTIIIDDEPEAIESLKQDLQEYFPKEIQLAGESTSINAGAILFKEEKPDLIFLDIDLKVGTGFDFLEKIAAYDHSEFEVVFTTAFNQFAIKAIKFSAFDYLLKPIDPDDLISTVERLKKNIADKQGYAKSNIELLLENAKSIDSINRRIAIPSHEKIHYHYLDEIIRCESNHNYTRFFFTDKSNNILVSKTIKEYEIQLDSYGFIRPHQRHLVNIKYVKSFLKHDGGSLELKDGTTIPVSRRKKDEILKRLQG